MCTIRWFSHLDYWCVLSVGSATLTTDVYYPLFSHLDYWCVLSVVQPSWQLLMCTIRCSAILTTTDVYYPLFSHLDNYWCVLSIVQPSWRLLMVDTEVEQNVKIPWQLYTRSNRKGVKVLVRYWTQEINCLFWTSDLVTQMSGRVRCPPIHRYIAQISALWKWIGERYRIKRRIDPRLIFFHLMDYWNTDWY